MRILLTLLIGLAALSGLQAQTDKDSRRYGIAVAPQTYPQGTAKDTLTSVLKAIDDKRIDYLLAQLTDPAFVDRQVAFNGGKFDALVSDTMAKLAADPRAVKQLRQFLKDGEWEVGETMASIRLKDVEDRRVYLRKLGGRWFLENAWKKSEERSK